MNQTEVMKEKKMIQTKIARRPRKRRRKVRLLVRLQPVWTNPDSFCQNQNEFQKLRKGERTSRMIKFFLSRSSYRLLLKW